MPFHSITQGDYASDVRNKARVSTAHLDQERSHEVAASILRKEGSVRLYAELSLLLHTQEICSVNGNQGLKVPVLMVLRQ